MATAEFNLRALADALDNVSDDVKRAVEAKAQTAATAMQYRVMMRYPIGPRHKRKGRWVGGGTLRASVVRGQPGRFAVSSHGAPVMAAVVRALAPHVHFYEEGAPTKSAAPRRDPTRLSRTGEPASRGVSPKFGPIFITAAIEERRRMFDEVQGLLNQPKEL